jgi:hypothetical protein
MKNFFTYNLGLKLIALALAIITWLYVDGQLLK